MPAREGPTRGLVWRRKHVRGLLAVVEMLAFVAAPSRRAECGYQVASVEGLGDDRGARCLDQRAVPGEIEDGDGGADNDGWKPQMRPRAVEFEHLDARSAVGQEDVEQEDVVRAVAAFGPSQPLHADVNISARLQREAFVSAQQQAKNFASVCVVLEHEHAHQVR